MIFIALVNISVMICPVFIHSNSCIVLGDPHSLHALCYVSVSFREQQHFINCVNRKSANLVLHI